MKSGKKTGPALAGALRAASAIRLLAAALCGALFTVTMPGIAGASSDAAWSAFRSQVAAACLAQARKTYADPIVVVHPFGSVSYGIALVYARTPVPRNAPPDNSLTTAVCVYNKRTKTAELSGPFRTAP